MDIKDENSDEMFQSEPRLDPSSSNCHHKEKFTRKKNILVLIFYSYFFGVFADSYFLYNFFNIGIRMIRDDFYFSMVSNGFSFLSLLCVIASFMPCLMIFCLPSVCLACCKNCYFSYQMIQFVCWIAFSFSVIPIIGSRVAFECIFVVFSIFHYMIRLSKPSDRDLIRYSRFLDAHPISFLYVSIFRWIFIGYVPSFVSGWFAALNISLGFVCLLYLIFEEIVFVIFSPNVWLSINTSFRFVSPSENNDIYPLYLLNNKKFFLPKKDIPKDDNILSNTKNNLLKWFCFEFCISFFFLFSSVLFGFGFGSIIKLLFQFALTPLTLTAWSGRQSYWDGLFTVISLFLGVCLCFFFRNLRKRSGKICHFIFFSPFSSIFWFVGVGIVFSLISYAFNLNFVFWTGNLLIICIPFTLEFFLNETIHFQFLMLSDLLEYVCCFFPFLFYLSRYRLSRKIYLRFCSDAKYFHVSRGPGIIIGCGYFLMSIYLVLNIGSWAYSFLPGIGDVMGGRLYIVFILIFLFLIISCFPPYFNRCLLLIRVWFYSHRFRDNFNCHDILRFSLELFLYPTSFDQRVLSLFWMKSRRRDEMSPEEFETPFQEKECSNDIPLIEERDENNEKEDENSLINNSETIIIEEKSMEENKHNNEERRISSNKDENLKKSGRMKVEEKEKVNISNVTCISQIILIIPVFLFLFVGILTSPAYISTGEDLSFHTDFYRIATYNVFHGYCYDGMDNGIHIAKQFLKKQKIDFCGFQETATNRQEIGYQEIVMNFGLLSGSPYYIQGSPLFDTTFGVAVVSRVPIGIVKNLHFDLVVEEGGVNNNYLYVTVEMNNTIVHIITSHYDEGKVLTTSESHQLMTFLDEDLGILSSDDNPIIIMGDLNSRPNDESIKVFLDNGFRDAYFEVIGTHDYTSNDHHCIDYIFVKGNQIKTVNAFVYRDENYGLRRSSDHYPVVVDVKILK